MTRERAKGSGRTAGAREKEMGTEKERETFGIMHAVGLERGFGLTLIVLIIGAMHANLLIGFQAPKTAISNL